MRIFVPPWFMGSGPCRGVPLTVLAQARKYGYVLVTRVKEDMAYRVNYVVGTLMRFIPMVTTVYLWYAVYQSSPPGAQKAGMTFRDVIAYFLLVYVARGFSSMPGMTREVSKEIKDGLLNRYLMKPIDYFCYQCSYRVAHKVVFWGVAIVTFPPIFWLMRGFFSHTPTLLEWVSSVLLLAMGFAIGMLFSFLVGILAFWFLEVSTFLFIVMGIETFASGHLIPLNFLPGIVQKTMFLLPFAYEAYWPCAVLMGKVPAGEVGGVLGVGAFWVLALYGACRWVWSRGVKHYSAVGG